MNWVHNLFQETKALKRGEIMAEDMIEGALEEFLALPETAAKYRFMRPSRYLTRRIH